MQQPQQYSINLRGRSFPVEFSTDIHIKAIEGFINNPVNSRQRQKDIAHAVQSLCPSIPAEWSSVTELERGDGKIEIQVVFNLNAYELIEIAQKSALAHVANLIVELEAIEPKTPEESAQNRNRIANLQKYLKETRTTKESHLMKMVDEGQKQMEKESADTATINLELPQASADELPFANGEIVPGSPKALVAATAPTAGEGFHGRTRPRTRG